MGRYFESPLSPSIRKFTDFSTIAVKGGLSRLYAGLARLDAVLASGAPLATPPEKLFQGPLADALGHVGQIALLRRLGGGPIRGENYFRADIAAGRVGPDQAPPRREFD